MTGYFLTCHNFPGKAKNTVTCAGSGGERGEVSRLEQGRWERTLIFVFPLGVGDSILIKRTQTLNNMTVSCISISPISYYCFGCKGQETRLELG